MDTLSALLAFCEGNPWVIGGPPITDGFPSHKGPVKLSFDTFLANRLNMNNMLHQQSNCLCSGTPWRSCDLTVVISKASRLRSPSGQMPNPKRQKHLNAAFGNFTTVTTASYSQNRSSIPCNQKHEIDLFCSNRVSIYSSAGLLGSLAQSTKQEPGSLGVHQG